MTILILWHVGGTVHTASPKSTTMKPLALPRLASSEWELADADGSKLESPLL